jgi:hypothetical protein
MRLLSAATRVPTLCRYRCAYFGVATDAPTQVPTLGTDLRRAQTPAAGFGPARTDRPRDTDRTRQHPRGSVRQVVAPASLRMILTLWSRPDPMNDIRSGSVVSTFTVFCCRMSFIVIFSPD